MRRGPTLLILRHLYANQPQARITAKRCFLKALSDKKYRAMFEYSTAVWVLWYVEEFSLYHVNMPWTSAGLHKSGSEGTDHYTLRGFIMGFAVYTMHVGADGKFLNGFRDAGEWAHRDFDVFADCARI
jgi:hypothetical protein